MQAGSQSRDSEVSKLSMSSGSASERDWQFRVADGKSHEADNGISYFERRAGALAASLGCRLAAMKNVRLEMSREKVWLVKGTAIVENPRVNLPDNRCRKP